MTYIPNTTIVAVAASCVSYGGQIVSRIRTRNTSPRALPRGLNLPKNMRPTIPLSRDGARRPRDGYAAGARRACGEDAVKLHKPSCSRFDD